MVPYALLCEQTETAKPASHSNDEGTGTEGSAAPGGELMPDNMLVDELADEVVHLEELRGASDYPVDLPVPQVQHGTMELRSFTEAFEDACFKVGGTEHDGEGVPGSNAPDHGVVVAQEPGRPCVQTSWIRMGRGAFTAEPTMHEYHNSGEPLFHLGEEIDLGGGLWPTVRNYSPSQVDNGFRTRKKRRLNRLARGVRRKRMKRRAARTNQEEDSGCDADTEYSSKEEEEDDDDDEDEDEEVKMVALGLCYLQLGSTG